MLTRDLLAFVRSALPAPPASVLEIGAGQGELSSALQAAGFDMTAIDPAAEPGSHVRRCSLLEVTGTFDAAVSVVALHHVDPLEESCAHLATLLPSGARLVIDELDIDQYDARALTWWLGQRQALGRDNHGRDGDQILNDLRHHIHPLSRIVAALAPGFTLGAPIRGPYLHRWELLPSLYETEVDLIAEGRLPAVGARHVAIRH